MGDKVVAFGEVAKHNSKTDAWMIIHGKVWNLTTFLKQHPGGEKVLLDNIGKDGTHSFSMIHPRDLVEKVLDAKQFMVGKVDPSTLPQSNAASANAPVSETRKSIPNVRTMLNIFDFEAVAKHVMNHEGWSYYSSGSDDEITLRENHAAFSRIWLKPRVLVDVAKIDMTTKICGTTSSIPLYISATALGKLAHPDGELAITRGAFSGGVPYMLPTLSSYSLEEMLEARAPGQVVWSQLYVNSERHKSEEYVAKLISEGVRALFVTVDAPQLGRREKDMRNKMQSDIADVQKGDAVDRSQGVTRAISAFIDPSFSWKDVDWLKKMVGSSGTKLYLKGVQCGEDAVLAFRAGLHGIVISNHGGRQLDLSRSAIEILPEVMQALRKESGYRKENFEVFIDGGIRRGADIFKAIALGATAVGVGRPAIYALAGYGQQGVERMLEVLKEELMVCMRLMGTPGIEDITEGHVLTKNLNDHIPMMPTDYLPSKTYERLRTQQEIALSSSKL